MVTRNASVRFLLAAGVVAASVACSQWASMLLWMPNPRSHMVWFPGAVLLCALLLQPRSRWGASILGTALGEALAFGVLGVPVLTVAWSMVGTLALTPIAALALSALRDHLRSPLEDFRLLTAFVLIGGVAVPMLSAAWIAVVTRGTVLEPYLSDWPNVTLAQSLGILMLVPAVVWGALRKRNPAPLEISGEAALVGGGLFVLLCVLWAAPLSLDRMQPALMVAPVPLLIWAMVCFRAAGASLAMLLVGLLAMHFSAAGVGPFITANLATTTIAVQLWTATLTVGLLYMTVVAEQRANRTRELQLAHQQLQSMTVRLMRAQEDERSRIARDLHDGINQTVASIAIRLSIARQHASGAERVLLSSLQEAVTAVSDDIRQLSHELHPSLLRYTGLAPALQALCQTPDAGTLIKTELDEVAELPLDVSTALYRIAQEALRNVAKHAQASAATVRLFNNRGDVVLEVIDDGIGYVPSLQEAYRGLGVLSMRERAQEIGGAVQIGAGRGGGTIVRVRVPLGR